jgi:hypothetical protein
MLGGCCWNKACPVSQEENDGYRSQNDPVNLYMAKSFQFASLVHQWLRG